MEDAQYSQDHITRMRLCTLAVDPLVYTQDSQYLCTGRAIR